MKRALLLVLMLAFALPQTATGEVLLGAIIQVIVDGGNDYAWERVALPGTQCGNGSQYKFFIRRAASPGSPASSSPCVVSR